MIFDSAEETQELKMGDLHIQLLPNNLPALSPSPPPPVYTLNPVLETKDRGFDFYSSPFDNSYPYKGILSNERSFSSSSTASDASFTPFLKRPQQVRNTNSNENHGLLTTSTPTRESQNGSSAAADFHNLLDGGGDFDGNFFPQENQFNDSAPTHVGILSNKWESPMKSQNRFDFSFTTPPENSIFNNGSGRSMDSPEHSLNGTFINNYSNYANQWCNGDSSFLLDNPLPDSCSSTAPIALGNPVWSSSQVSANNASNNDRQWDVAILRTLSKQDLLKFKATLKAKLEEFTQEGNHALASQCHVAYMQVTEHLISNFVQDHDPETPPTNSSSSKNGSTTSQVSSTSQNLSPTSQNLSPTSSQIVSPTPLIVPSLPLIPTPIEHGYDRDRARMHRNATEYKVAPQTWHGILPPRNHRNATYSHKVFLGGLPWDITENTLMHTFRAYGIMKIEWPGKDQVSSKQIKGYAYAIFENEKHVRNLLSNCTQDFTSSQEGKYFFKISTKKYRGKEVEVIPWGSTDCTFNHTCKIDADRTIFVGALHGMVNAEALANIMSDLFGGVIFAGIDLDKNKYPIGSARVTFSNKESYLHAVNSRFVFIKTARFTKKLQVDPYLEDHRCDVCELQQGPYFCREPGCFHYFCRTCFQETHASPEMQNHEPIMRNQNNRQSYATTTNTGIYSPSYNRWSNQNNLNGRQNMNGNHHGNGNDNYPPMNPNQQHLNGQHSPMNGSHPNGMTGNRPHNANEMYQNNNRQYGRNDVPQTGGIMNGKYNNGYHYGSQQRHGPHHHQQQYTPPHPQFTPKYVGQAGNRQQQQTRW